MKSEIIGAGTFKAEVLNVSPHGFWVFLAGREHFLDFERIWMSKARRFWLEFVLSRVTRFMYRK